jgi:hypothetical protein
METFAKELMRRAVKPTAFSQVIADGVDDIWAMDLADMTEWAASNDGYKHILVIVDAFSRYAWCVPLKTKTAKDVWDAFESVLTVHSMPKKVWVDRGTEFYNSYWTAKLKAGEITRYSTGSGEYKVSLAERFIRTLKSKIWLHFMTTGGRRWIDVLPSIVKEYNSTIHSSIGFTPADARKTENSNKLYGQYRPPGRGKPKYKLGEWVRISRVKGTFEKGFHPNWSYEIFKIIGIRATNPVCYYLQDYDGDRIEGIFYENNLQPVADSTFFPIEKVVKERTVKGVKEKLVKFLGYKEPRWMLAEVLSDV